MLEQVTFLDEELNLRTLPASQLEMGYRTSVFEKNPAWCILSATLRLRQGDAGAILAQMQDSAFTAAATAEDIHFISS